MNEYIKVRSDIDEEAFNRIEQFIDSLGKHEDKLVKAVSAVLVEHLDDSGKVTLSDSLIAQIEDEVATIFSDVAEGENQFANEVLEHGYLTAHDETSKLLGLSANWNILRDEFVKAALDTPIDGTNFSERIWNNCDDLAQRIYNDVLDCIRTGKRPREIARAIRDDFGGSNYQAVRLVSTELARVTATAQLDVYHNSGVVEKVRFLATLEKNTCDICAGYDGNLYDLDSVPAIPVHPCCRCCHVPVIDGYKPSKRADNETKETIDYLTYAEWKAQKTK